MGKITVIRWGKSSLSLKKFGKSKSIIVSDTVGNMLDRHRVFFQQLFCLINAGTAQDIPVEYNRWRA